MHWAAIMTGHRPYHESSKLPSQRSFIMSPWWFVMMTVWVCVWAPCPGQEIPTTTEPAVLERYLLLMNDLPGLEVRSVIHPASGAPGTAVLVLKVHHKPFSTRTGINNRGSRYAGPVHLSLGAQANGVLGHHERLSVRVIGASQTDSMPL